MPSSAAKKKPAARLPAVAEAAPVDLNGAVIARAQRVLEKNPSLGKIYERLVKLVAEATHDEALTRYRIGGLVRSVSDDEEKYGKRSVETLAALLSFDKTTLYDYANVAGTWDEKALKAMLRRKNALGLSLRFSHLVVLAKVADGRRRNALVNRVLDQNLTVRQLEELLRSGAASGDEVVPDPPTPTPVDAIRRVTARWEAAVGEIERDTHELVELAALRRSPEVLEALRATAERQRELAKTANACAEQLGALAGKAT